MTALEQRAEEIQHYIENLARLRAELDPRLDALAALPSDTRHQIADAIAALRPSPAEESKTVSGRGWTAIMVGLRTRFYSSSIGGGGPTRDSWLRIWWDSSARDPLAIAEEIARQLDALPESRRAAP